jgi:hypothetical protein
MLRRSVAGTPGCAICADIRFEVAELRALIILAQAKITNDRTDIRIVIAQGECHEKGPQALGH